MARMIAADNTIEPDSGNTCAVIITFHPDAEFRLRVAALSAQIGFVFIIDNGSGSATAAMLTALESPGKIATIYNDTNLGVAAALNQGLRRAREEGYRWAVTFDQDSTVLPRFAEIAFGVYRQCPERARLGVIGSAYKDPTVDDLKRINRHPAASAYAVRRTAITSGCLTSLDAFGVVGPFLEDYFIDGVDEEYCLRLRRHGYVVVSASEVALTHSIGRMSEHRWIGVRYLTTNHSALRRYYMTRNVLVTFVRYWSAEPGWVIRKAFWQVYELLGIVLFESDKVRKLTAAAFGFLHAFTHRMGSAPETLARLLTDARSPGEQGAINSAR